MLIRITRNNQSAAGYQSLYPLSVDDDALVDLMGEAARAIQAALNSDLAQASTDPREPGERPGQFRIDLVTESAAMPIFDRVGISVLSEEVGLVDRGGELVVVMDPVDGSTNASRGIPWYATSLCIVDDGGLRAALIMNLATDRTYTATRGGGAFRDGLRVRPSSMTQLGESMLVLNGFDPAFLTWMQYRSLGATALDLCSVADGTVDASIDFSGALGPWDYMGAMLIQQEAGAVIVDQHGRDLLEIGHEVRRKPASAANRELLDQILEARGPGLATGR